MDYAIFMFRMLLVAIVMVGLTVGLASGVTRQQLSTRQSDSKLDIVVETVSSLKSMAEAHNAEMAAVASKLRVLADQVKELKAASNSQFNEVKTLLNDLHTSFSEFSTV
jgi:peptidoglycan hydrolase CwlO-like protein